MASYLVTQLGRRVSLFFVRWYVSFSKRFWGRVLDIASDLDRTFAIKINARLWLQPLYGDYSPVGRIIGPIFRTLRIFFGFVAYFFIFVFAAFLWVLWLLIPPYILLNAFIG